MCHPFSETRSTGSLKPTHSSCFSVARSTPTLPPHRPTRRPKPNRAVIFPLPDHPTASNPGAPANFTIAARTRRALPDAVLGWVWIIGGVGFGEAGGGVTMPQMVPPFPLQAIAKRGMVFVKNHTMVFCVPMTAKPLVMTLVVLADYSVGGSSGKVAA